MKNYFKWAVVFVISFLVMGCNFYPEQIALKPTAYSADATNIGHGKIIALKVIDGIDNSQIGRRASGLGPLAPITLADNSSSAIYEAVSAGLTARGFNPVDSSTHHAPTTLTLTLNQLKYVPKAPVMTIGVYVHSQITALATHNGSRYEQTYRAERNRDYQIVPGASQDHALVNRVISDNIDRIFFDRKLMDFLAK